MNKELKKYLRKAKKINRTIIILGITIFTLGILISIIQYIITSDKGEDNDQGISKVITDDDFTISNEGTTYYVSTDGNSTDGTDINNPMSFENAKNKQYNGNDKLLFKCGDTFYGNITFNVKTIENEYFYVGSYGDGEKPIISGAETIGNNWNLVEDGIYSFNLLDTSEFEGYKSKSTNVGFMEDYNGNTFGSRKRDKENFINDMDFCVIDNVLYVKSTQNPYEKYGKLKLATNVHLLTLVSNMIVENLNIQYTGAHGMRKGGGIKNVKISNCIIQNIGGSVQNESTFARYGNGIEFWLSAQNIIVENNIIRNVYDASFTIQGDSGSWDNVIVRNNLLIKNCYSFELWGSETSTGMTNVQIYNNICICEGKGWGQVARRNPYNSAEYVFYSYGDNAKMDIKIYNNKYLNTTRMYFVISTLKSRFKQNISADNNKMYWGKDTIYVNDYANISSRDFSYLYEEYNVEQNSVLHNLTEKQLEKINNEQILNSNDYNEIKTYYQNITNAIDASVQVTELQSKYEQFEEKYNSEIKVNTNIKQKINNIITKLQNIETDNQLSSNNIEELLNLNYEIGAIVISSKASTVAQMLTDINEIGNKYIEALEKISIANNNLAEIPNDKITELRNNIDANGDLQNIELVKSIYQNILEDNKKYNENESNLGIQLGRSIQIQNLLSWASKALEIGIEDYISNAKIEISYSTTDLTNQDVTATIETEANIQITNNSNSKKYIFKDNGTFDFKYTIKGQPKEIRATVNNIDKIQPTITNVENDKLYTKAVKPKITDVNLQKVELYKNNNFVNNYIANSEISEEGHYKIIATDKAKNESSMEFYIASNPARIEYSTESLTNEDVVAKLNSDFEFKVNNNSGQDTYKFTNNGTFEFEYTIKKQSLKITATVNNIDKIPPTISGVNNKKSYIGKVKPIISDKNLQEVQLYQNDELVENYKTNAEITEEGIYKLIAIDKAGNKTIVEFGIVENEINGYQIKDSYILNIKNNTTKAQFEKQMNIETNYEILRNGKILKNEEKIVTGDVLKTVMGESYTLVVAGDITKDGNVNIYDLNKLKIYILTGKNNFDDVQNLAADVDLDGKKLGIKDLIRIRILILIKDT